jgi:hypothetical protein
MLLRDATIDECQLQNLNETGGDRTCADGIAMLQVEISLSFVLYVVFYCLGAVSKLTKGGLETAWNQ